jgi:peptidoglycan/LPS O-acetylase OafA/YrhL
VAAHYRPEIDGLRALAVIGVMLYHVGVPGVSGGFLGVDMFFVISGFLITQLVVEESAAGRFTLRRFYLRRARRLLPALLAAACCSGR